METKQYYIIEPARFKLDGGAMFGIIPKPLWNKVHPADEQNRIELALRLVLIRSGKRNILIDTGIGDYHGEKFDQRFGITNSNSPLESALKDIGLLPGDITDLVISHLHFDHVGGIAKFVDGKITPTLPNAKVHLHKDHFEYSKHPTERDTGSFQIEYFLPILEWYQSHNKVNFLSGKEGEILPGLKFKCSMGHTPFLIHAYDENFIYMADLIPTSNHIHIPWVMGYDISPGVTTEDKKEFLPFIAKNNLLMIYEHDPKYLGSKVRMSEKGQFEAVELAPAQETIAYSVEI